MLCTEKWWCEIWLVFFFQAEDGIRDLVRSRGLGDVYKRQGRRRDDDSLRCRGCGFDSDDLLLVGTQVAGVLRLSLIHI